MGGYVLRELGEGGGAVFWLVLAEGRPSACVRSFHSSWGVGGWSCARVGGEEVVCGVLVPLYGGCDEVCWYFVFAVCGARLWAVGGVVPLI